MATFFVHKSDDNTQVVKLEKPRITLGRREDNDIILDDMFVSRNHAQVEKKGVFYYIRDQQSRFGTFVNGNRITEARLDYGDEIQMGNTVITFVDEDKIDQVPTPKKPSNIYYKRTVKILSLGLSQLTIVPFHLQLLQPARRSPPRTFRG